MVYILMALIASSCHAEMSDAEQYAHIRYSLDHNGDMSGTDYRGWDDAKPKPAPDPAVAKAAANAWAKYKAKYPNSVEQDVNESMAASERTRMERVNHEAENQALIDALQNRPEPAKPKAQTCVTRQRKNIYNQVELVTECN